MRVRRSPAAGGFRSGPGRDDTRFSERVGGKHDSRSYTGTVVRAPTPEGYAPPPKKKRRTSKPAANQGIVGSGLPARAPHRGTPAEQEMDGLRTGEELAASAASQTEPARRGSPPPGAYPARLDLAEGGETTREERNAFSRGSEGPSPTTHAEVKDPASAARELLKTGRGILGFHK